MKSTILILGIIGIVLMSGCIFEKENYSAKIIKGKGEIICVPLGNIDNWRTEIGWADEEGRMRFLGSICYEEDIECYFFEGDCNINLEEVCSGDDFCITPLDKKITTTTTATTMDILVIDIVVEEDYNCLIEIIERDVYEDCLKEKSKLKLSTTYYQIDETGEISKIGGIYDLSQRECKNLMGYEEKPSVCHSTTELHILTLHPFFEEKPIYQSWSGQVIIDVITPTNVKCILFIDLVRKPDFWSEGTADIIVDSGRKIFLYCGVDVYQRYYISKMMITTPWNEVANINVDIVEL